MKLTQESFDARLKNATRLENDPIWQLAYDLYDMGINSQELHKLCDKAHLIPDPVKNRLINFYFDIDRIRKDKI